MVCAITNNLHDIKKPKRTELLFFVIIFVILKHTILKNSLRWLSLNMNLISFLVKDLEYAILVIPINCIRIKIYAVLPTYKVIKKYLKQG